MNMNKYNQPVGDNLIAWQPVKRPAEQELKGAFCGLEPLDPERHYKILFDAYRQAPDGRDWTYLFAEYPENEQDLLTHLRSLVANDTLVNMAVIDLATGKAVGTVAYMRIDCDNGVIEIGHVNWSPAMKKRTCATEAIYLMVQLVFDELGYRRCEWKCDRLNEPSRQAALRFGFDFEGTFRNAIVTKGRNRDTDWFSITVEDWPEIKAAFVRWLNPDNFTPEGQQILRLQSFMPASAGMK